MTDDREQTTQPATPPGGGRQDHQVMREAASLPVSGPASTDTLAAGGGLEVPGREVHPPATATQQAPVPEPIPGERDPHVLTHRQPGAMGGGFAGTSPPAPANAPDAADTDREGA